MVEIRKNEKKMEVPVSAFNNFYKSAGWELSQEEVDDEGWDEVLGDDFSEKPLSQMNSTELIEKAVSLGLSVGSNPTKRQLREMISAASR